MKTLLIFAAIVACACAYPTSPLRPPVGEQRGARTIKFENEADIGAGYRYSYEIDNGISAQQAGVPRDFGGNPPVVANVVQGAFQWTSPEGKLVSITYTADENGYQPVGEAIPQ